MANWDLYAARLNVNGYTRRERSINKFKKAMAEKIVHSPACDSYLVDGIQQSLVVSKNSNKLTQYTIHTLPDETISVGQYVVDGDNTFLITEAEQDNEMYMTGRMELCNYILRFQNKSTGEIISRPAIFAKSTGGVLDSNVVLSVSGATHVVKLPLDDETKLLRINNRFLIDIMNDRPNAYLVVNRDVVSGYGLLILTLKSDEFNDDRDSALLMVADYFTPSIQTQDNCEINYSGKPEIRVGGSAKSFTAVFYESSSQITPIWTVVPPEGYGDKIISESADNTISIRALSDKSMIGKIITLKLDDSTGNCHAELTINIVGLI